MVLKTVPRLFLYERRRYMSKNRKRSKTVPMDVNQFRKKQFKVRCVASIPIALYLSLAVSGVFSVRQLKNIEILDTKNGTIYWL